MISTALDVRVVVDHDIDEHITGGCLEFEAASVVEGGDEAVSIAAVTKRAHVGLPEHGFSLGLDLERDAGRGAIVVAVGIL